jgi:hypothetical protein
MPADSVDGEEQLRALRQKASAVQEELARYYELLMREFWSDYPRLSYCEEVALSLGRMESWLKDQRARAGRQE